MRTVPNRLSKAAAIVAAAVLGVSVLAGCSSSGDSDANQTASEGSQVLPPIILEPGQTEATAKVGDFIVVKADDRLGTTIATDQPDVLSVQQAYDDETAEFNAGAEVLAPGNATITVTLPDGTSYDIAVTATE